MLVIPHCGELHLLPSQAKIHSFEALSALLCSRDEMKEVFTANPKLPCWVLAINVLNDLGWSQQGHRALQIPLCYGCSLPISEIKG